MTIWNDEERARVAELLRAGLSGGKIAKRMTVHCGREVSRGALISLVHRDKKLLAIGFKGVFGQRRKGQPKPNLARVPTMTFPKAPNPAHNITHNLLPKKEKPTPVPTVFECRSVPLVELGRGECRWPLNDPKPFEGFLFCGNPAEPDRSYCRGHYALSVGRGTTSERQASIDLEKAAA